MATSYGNVNFYIHLNSKKFGFVKILLLLVYFSVFNMINMKKNTKTLY